MGANQFGRCYYWAAQLAGIADLPKGQTFSGFVSDLVDRIQERFTNAALLQQHIETLSQKQLPVKFEYEILSSVRNRWFALFELANTAASLSIVIYSHIGQFKQ